MAASAFWSRDDREGAEDEEGGVEAAHPDHPCPFPCPFPCQEKFWDDLDSPCNSHCSILDCVGYDTTYASSGTMILTFSSCWTTVCPCPWYPFLFSMRDVCGDWLVGARFSFGPFSWPDGCDVGDLAWWVMAWLIWTISCPCFYSLGPLWVTVVFPCSSLEMVWKAWGLLYLAMLTAFWLSFHFLLDCRYDICV